jgi:microcompartment protein CcmL/EutN
VHDALALLELDSIARGYRALDALVKESPVEVIEANLVEPGKFLILTGGGVAEIESAHRVGREVAAESLLDEVLLPWVDPRVWWGLGGGTAAGEVDTVGIVEGRSVAGVIEAGDRSLKAADVQLLGLRVTPALGGKAFYVLGGRQHDVEAGVAAGVEVLTGRQKLVRAETIARPHPDFLAMVLRAAPFRAPGGG